MSELFVRIQTDGEQNSHFWRRFQLLWSALFVLAVGASATLGWQVTAQFPEQRRLGLILCLLMIGFHLVVQWIAYRTEYGRAPQHAALPYIIFCIAAWFFLIRISPVYYLVLFGLFSQIYSLLPLRYAAARTLTVAGLMAYSQTLGSDDIFSWQIGLIYLLMGVASVVLGAWIHGIIRQREERRELLVQLQATQAELADVERRAGVLAGGSDWPMKSTTR